MRVVIIGGGIAGLVAAYELSRAGGHVTLVERDSRLGGLAGSFAIEPGVEIERYYHFICKHDREYLTMLDTLGIRDRLRWATTEMGLFHNGTLRSFGDPIGLFTHPSLSLAEKVRFAVATVRAKLRRAGDWSALENRTAIEWLSESYGTAGYELLYRSLLEKKFRQFAPRISAAWMWARLNRVGNSRTITQRERIGYLVGGTQAYVDALAGAARSAGAEIRLCTQALELLHEGDRVAAVRSNEGALTADFVLVTVPIPHAVALFAGLDGAYFANLRSLEYINVLAVVLRLSRQFTRHFWTNISDLQIDLPGVIEFTNLNPCPELGGDAVLYMPQYLPREHPFWSTGDDELVRLFAVTWRSSARNSHPAGCAKAGSSAAAMPSRFARRASHAASPPSTHRYPNSSSRTPTSSTLTTGRSPTARTSVRRPPGGSSPPRASLDHAEFTSGVCPPQSVS